MARIVGSNSNPDDFKTANEMLEEEIEKDSKQGTVILCRQGCGTKVKFGYIDGKLVPINVRDGKKHVCFMYARAQMLGAKAGTIPMKRIIKQFTEIEQVVKYFNSPREWTATDFWRQLEANWHIITSNIMDIRYQIDQQELWNKEFIEKNDEYEAKYKPQAANDKTKDVEQSMS